MKKYLTEKYQFLSKNYDFNLELTFLSILIPICFLLVLKICMFISMKFDSDFEIKNSDLIEINSTLNSDSYYWSCSKGGSGRILQFKGYKSFFYIPCFLKGYFESKQNVIFQNILTNNESSYYTFKILKSDKDKLSTDSGVDIYELKWGNLELYNLGTCKMELTKSYQLNGFWYFFAGLICLIINLFAFRIIKI